MKFRKWWSQPADWNGLEGDQIDDLLIAPTENYHAVEQFLEFILEPHDVLVEGPDAFDWIIASNQQKNFIPFQDVVVCRFQSIYGKSTLQDLQMAELQLEEHAILSVETKHSTDETTRWWFIQVHYRELGQRIASAYGCNYIEWAFENET